MPLRPTLLSEAAEALSASEAAVHQIASAASAPDGPALPLLIQVLHTHLEMLAQQLERISDSTYTDATLDPCFGSSIGSHVRHILDHIHNLSQPATTIDYEARRRGDAIESSRVRALHRISELQAAVCALPKNAAPDGTVRISAIPAPGLAPLMLHSTLERECLYVIDHTIHHLAMIRTLLSRAGHCCPSTLGLAAGTPAPCAR